MRRLVRRTVCLTLALTLTGLLSLLPAAPATAKDATTSAKIPRRPEDLSFPPLVFEVPDPAKVEHRFSFGAPAYVAEDHSLPLVQISLTLRGGSYLDPQDKPGVAELTGRLMRRGGTTKHKAEDFDEQAEFLAAEIHSFASEASMGASVSCITQVLDECLSLFFEMVTSPEFQQDRLEIEKGRILEDLKQRNDDARSILGREWAWQMYGEDYFVSRRITAKELEAIHREDLLEFHRRMWRPENVIASVSGDVVTGDILKRLETHLAKLPQSDSAAPWPPPKPAFEITPGLYYVDKEIPQGKVYFGHPIPQVTDWNHPDLPALQIMNRILGGGGFTSRIVKRVRSDEGLAYSAGSRLRLEPFWPGEFFVSYQSKSSTVALAAKIALEEIRRIQQEKASEEELSVAKSSLVDTFPRRFESARQISGTFAYDAYLGRSHSYWKTWRARVRAVTLDDVQRVAQEYLKPDSLVFVIVGDWKVIAAGDSDHRASIGDLFGGEPQRLPLRDPLTLEPVP